MILSILFLIVCILGYFLWKFYNISKTQSNELNILKNRFKDVLNADEEKIKIEKEITNLKDFIEVEKLKLNEWCNENKKQNLIEINEEKENLKTEIKNLENYKNYNMKEVKKQQENIKVLRKEVAELEEKENLYQVGFYNFKYDFEKSETYNIKLEENRKNQENILKNKEAAKCKVNWEVEGSKQQGKTLVTNILKLALRAFNGECNVAIAKVKYNNISLMENRIKKSFEIINKMLSNFRCYISEEYLKNRLDELYLTYEYEDLLQKEREEQRLIKEQMKEEERAQRELERAKIEAEKEEERTKKALEKAEEKLKKAHGEEIVKMSEQIEFLKSQLEKAQTMREKATSMAQLTKSGYVYVISNIGSFGENVYKIGMTRRLEPMDRVRELGDASVPFNFDVHAMIFSDNAPELENTLHKEFYNNRVNKVNDRREFFRVDLEKIKEVAQKYKADIKFTMIAEAEQYRQTLAMEKEMLEKGDIIEPKI